MRMLATMKHAVLAGILLVGTGCSQASTESSGLRSTTGRDLRLIRHVVVIMQENRSFDHYFGTYPGADGIPVLQDLACPPSACRIQRSDRCVKPFHDSADVNGGGPHNAGDAVTDIDRGRMDGFIKQAEGAQRRCINPNNPSCAAGTSTDVMGYHDSREIPNYWAYARTTLCFQDQMFQPQCYPGACPPICSWCRNGPRGVPS